MQMMHVHGALMQENARLVGKCPPIGEEVSPTGGRDDIIRYSRIDGLQTIFRPIDQLFRYDLIHRNVSESRMFPEMYHQVL